MNKIPAPQAAGEDTELYRRWAPYWKALSESCRENPNKWFFYEGLPSQYTYHINNGLLKDFAPAGTFESYTKSTDGVRKMYVRFVGADTE